MDRKSNENPIDRIVLDHAETYGAEADGLIRHICDLTSREETYEWWEKEIGAMGDGELALNKARQQFDYLTSWQRQNPGIQPDIYSIENYRTKTVPSDT
jgi:hypothetical protein